MPRLIEVLNLSKTYPDGTQGLIDVDLAFGDGMLGLLGPNGAGKTTLLSILALAQEPSKGERVYFGIGDSPAHRSQIRRMIGYLPQEFEPVATLSGIEYLMMCAELRRVPLRRRDLERRAASLLDAVELTHAARRRADTYSGGMIRRLGLAQALIHAPKFLVVDEPTAGLDPEERIRFRNLITDLAEEIPVLLSTHIVEDIEATCPRLGVIARGRLLFDGEPSELMTWSRERLWRLPADRDVPEEALKIGQRVGEGGAVFNVLFREQQIAGAEHMTATLEEACAAFLIVEAGQTVTGDDTVDAEEV
ncbi:MAG: ATP-binding cassette domain-containing protein [bacterium]|nr:ATP-binding cassette domain-containing protein [bacterium]